MIKVKLRILLVHEQGRLSRNSDAQDRWPAIFASTTVKRERASRQVSGRVSVIKPKPLEVRLPILLQGPEAAPASEH